MRKLLFAMLACTITLAFASCREKKAKDKVKDRVENVKESVEEASKRRRTKLKRERMK